MRTLAPAFLAALALAGCSSMQTVREESVAAGAAAREGIGDAVLAPLEIVNLKREEIPITLRALRGPYPLRAPRSCEEIASHVADLSEVLGPDADEPSTGADGSVGEKAGEQALDVLSDTATDFIPFRGAVRYATGATAHERKLREAYQNGVARRAYLKGLGEAMGCEGRAAPDRRY
jgi:hypothetical protein